MEKELFYKNKKFRIMLVGDPHEKVWEESVTVQNKIKDFLYFQEQAVKEVKPDLVVLMGDNASGSTPEDIREVLLRITAPYVKAGVPFTFILGNHDLESKVSALDEHYAIYKSLPGIVFPGEYSPYGDYVISVKSSDKSKTLLNLWHIYNGAHPDKKYHSHYSSVSPEQIRWYEQQAEKRKENDEVIPAIVFQHVPVSEEYNLVNEKSPFVMLFDGVNGQDGHYGRFFNLKKTTKGYMGESPCVADYNCGQFASWKKTGDVFAAFFGHDHMNDLIGETDGILLGQCKTASFRVYGDGLMQGVRVIDLDEEAPRTLQTKMVYYRELVGNQCRSIQGRDKIFQDRINVKLDVLGKIAKYAVPVGICAVILNMATKRR